ncbi:MAG: chemotaxis protein CheW [Bacteroidota bacterium]
MEQNHNMQQNTETYFIFRILEEYFAVEIERVDNVLEMTKPARIPETPDYLEGIINVRGALLPVVNARLKFGMKNPEFNEDACIIILEIFSQQEHFKLGLMVDYAEDVFTRQHSSTEKVPDMGLKMNPDYIKGAFVKKDEIVFVLDIDEIFSQKEVTELLNADKNQKDK